ncbi:MAG: hypothetical protein ACU843_00870 [Gammaproteobacteria bacterium]
MFDEPGALARVELATSASSTALAFYKSLPGWGANTYSIFGERYTVFSQGDQRIGGMVEEHVQAPRRRIYIAAADCAAPVRGAEELGGSKIVAPISIPGSGLSPC